jgi:hypothetical protein
MRAIASTYQDESAEMKHFFLLIRMLAQIFWVFQTLELDYLI